jgi:hypothetical protein
MLRINLFIMSKQMFTFARKVTFYLYLVKQKMRLNTGIAMKGPAVLVLSVKTAQRQRMAYEELKEIW